MLIYSSFQLVSSALENRNTDNRSTEWLHTDFIRKLVSSNNYVFLKTYIEKSEKLSFPGTFGASEIPFICIHCIISSLWKLRFEEVTF